MSATTSLESRRSRGFRTILDEQSSDDELLTDAQIAAEGGPRLGTLRNWRLSGKGPPALKIGRLVRYRRGDYLRWLSQHYVVPRGD